MSIIYEALKKVEKIKQKNSYRNYPFLKNTLMYILLLATGLFAAGILFRILSPARKSPADSIENKSTAAQQVLSAQPLLPQERKPQTLFQKEDEKKNIPLPRLFLNGIFMDKACPYVLINNTILKKGDVIQEAKVISIESDKVKLDFKGRTIELQM
jgi:hypothetical protein